MFIVFEGGAGGGKSTQINLLATALKERGYQVKAVSVLDDTEVGKWVRQITGSVPHGTLGHMTEALLFLSAIVRAVESIIRPALANGSLVGLVDRYVFSTIAYQGYGGGIDITFLTAMAMAAVGQLEPDLVVYLDLSAQEGLSRHSDAHAEQLAFRERVREGYRRMAKNDQRWLVIDAREDIEKIHQIILREVLKRLALSQPTG
jgi:dTMP kinase